MRLLTELMRRTCRNFFSDFYQRSPFVGDSRNPASFRRPSTFTEPITATSGWRYDKRTNRVIVVSAIDNLVKGAAGQAIQNMNLMCGFDETAGLTMSAVWP